jgi:hypothetical protein
MSDDEAECAWIYGNFKEECFFARLIKFLK